MAPTQPFKARARKSSTSDTQTKSRGLDRRDSRQGASSTSGQHRARTSRSPERDHGRLSTERTKKRRKHHVERKIGIGDVSEEIYSSDDSQESDLDLTKPLHAIGDHLDDRRTLVGEMFKSLKNDTLMRMIPPVLRELSLKELEEKCVFELDGLSRKRVRGILTGQDVVSSSGTDDSEEEQDTEKKSAVFSLEQARPSCEGSVPHQSQRLVNQGRPTSSQIRSKGKSESPVDQSGRSGSATSVEDLCMNEVEPMQMELVELELRAQAIRAMMKQLEENDTNLKALSKSSSRSRSKSSSSTSASVAAIVSDLKKEPEKDLFEIHVDEDELAEFL